MRICDDPPLTDANVSRDSVRGEHSHTPPPIVTTAVRASKPVQLFGRVCLWLSQCCVIVLVCALPWWFGGIQPTAQLVCGCTVLAATILMLGAEFFADAGEVDAPRVMLTVLFAALALGGLQLLPLPYQFLAAIAPQNASLWQQLTPIHEPTVNVQLGSDTADWIARTTWPVSLYAASSKHDLALLCVGVGVFLIGAFQFSSDRALRILLVSVAICGTLFGFFGIAQQLTWNGKIYGTIELSNGGLPFAAFVNRNNAGGFLNLCLSACLGLLVWSLSYNRRRSRLEQRGMAGAGMAGTGVAGTEYSTPQDSNATASVPKRTRPANDNSMANAGREILANVSGLQVFAALTSIVILGAVLCTLSRGALLACLLSLALVAIASGLLVKSRWLNAASWVLLGIGGAGLTAWVGRMDDIQQRAGAMTNFISHPDGRWGHWRDSLAVAADFWPLGSGLGTHRFIYRLYERFPSDVWFFHAENQYVEALVETGWLGLGLLLAAVALTAVASWQLLRNGIDTIDRVLGVVGLFAISSQAIHACFDFGLYLPANMCLLALFCGIIHGRNARRIRFVQSKTKVAELPRFTRNPNSQNLRTGFGGQTARMSAATAICGLLVAAVMNLFGQAQVDAAIRSLPALPALPEKSPTPAQSEHDPQSIRAWEMASLRNPEDAETRLRAAEAWIDRYRYAAWESLVPSRPNTDPNELWTLTAPAEVHTFARALEQSRRSVELEDFRSSRAVRENLVPAVSHLRASRAACPLLADVHLLLSELEPVVSSHAGAGVGVQRVRICAPRHAQWLAEAGLVALVNSQPDLAAAMWRQAGTVEPQRLPALLRVAASQLVMRNHLQDILPQDVLLLVHAARESFSSDEDHDLQTLTTKYAKEILPAAEFDDAQRCHIEGLLLLLENQPKAAIDRLTKASQMNPLEVSWRFDLATALAKHGMMEQARDHASFCTRMEPDNEQYSDLLKRLIRTSLTSP